MKKKYGFSLEPQIIDEHTWYYEEKKGLHIYRNKDGEDVFDVVIPWKKIWDSCERYNLEPPRDNRLAKNK